MKVHNSFQFLPFLHTLVDSFFHEARFRNPSSSSGNWDYFIIREKLAIELLNEFLVVSYIEERDIFQLVFVPLKNIVPSLSYVLLVRAHV